VTQRLWTGKGDDGTSGLLFGGREPKTSARFAAIGAVDEAQAFIGLARAEVRAAATSRGAAKVAQDRQDLEAMLTTVAAQLWVLNAELATAESNRSKLEADATMVSAGMVAQVEAMVTDVAGRFELPKEFVVPGQDRGSALLDVARTVVRRAERHAADVAVDGSLVLPYLNRLSTLLWTLARWVEGRPLKSRQA
jgi:cob(I)alamin adenosyltransferase